MYGSNTRPRAIVNKGFSEKLLNQPAYFDKLDKVKFTNAFEHDILHTELTNLTQIPDGSLHWNRKKCKDRVFIKCKGDLNQWVYFQEVTLSGIGKVKAKDLMLKVLSNKPYNQMNNPKFDF